MRSAYTMLANFLLTALLGSLLFGCGRQKEAPASDAEVKSAAGYEALLPKGAVPAGWRQSEPVKVYPGKKLYDSIDGAADRFFQYAFREQYVASYKPKDGEGRLNVEAYDMGTSDDAFGIFSCHDSVRAERADVGLAAIISDTNLDFCQGKYFVRLLAMGFGEGEAREHLQPFARAIAGNVKPSAELPALLKRLPEGYLAGSVLFFHTWQTLNERRFLEEENVFRLDEKTRKNSGVLASYTSEERKTDDQTFKLEKDMLYLIQYPDPDAARLAWESYMKSVQKMVNDSVAPGQPEDEALQLVPAPEEPIRACELYKGKREKRHLTAAVRLFENYIFGFWDASDADKARGLAETLAARLGR